MSTGPAGLPNAASSSRFGPVLSLPFRAVLFPTLLALLACAACGGDRGRLHDGVYRGRDSTFAVGTLPPTWSPVGVGRNDLAFSHPELASIIQVNASCDPQLDIPLEALSRHLLIGFTGREVHSEERVPLDAREALRTHVTASLDGVPRELLLYVLKKDGCVYDFALVAPPGERFTRARADFQGFMDGFSTRGGGGS